jgi:hypothetical protein
MPEPLREALPAAEMQQFHLSIILMALEPI